MKRLFLLFLIFISCSECEHPYLEYEVMDNKIYVQCAVCGERLYNIPDSPNKLHFNNLTIMKKILKLANHEAFEASQLVDNSVIFDTDHVHYIKNANEVGGTIEDMPWGE